MSKCDYCMDTGKISLDHGCPYCRGEQPRPAPPCVAVKLSTLQARGTWNASEYCGSTSEVDQAIDRSEQALKAARTRVKNLRAEKRAILDTHKGMVKSGQIKVLGRRQR